MTQQEVKEIEQYKKKKLLGNIFVLLGVFGGIIFGFLFMNHFVSILISIPGLILNIIFFILGIKYQASKEVQDVIQEKNQKFVNTIEKKGIEKSVRLSGIVSIIIGIILLTISLAAYIGIGNINYKLVVLFLSAIIYIVLGFKVAKSKLEGLNYLKFLLLFCFIFIGFSYFFAKFVVGILPLLLIASISNSMNKIKLFNKSAFN